MKLYDTYIPCYNALNNHINLESNERFKNATNGIFENGERVVLSVRHIDYDVIAIRFFNNPDFYEVVESEKEYVKHEANRNTRSNPAGIALKNGMIPVSKIENFKGKTYIVNEN